MIKMHVTSKGSTKKPHFGSVMNDLKNQSKMEVDFFTFIQYIYNGYSFSPFTYENEPKKENLKSKQLFCLDFDNKKEKKITISEFLLRCHEIGIKPILVYESWNSTSDLQKFHAIFKHTREFSKEEEILIRFTNELLYSVFPESDIELKNNIVQIISGTNKSRNKNLEFPNEEFELIDLFLKVCEYKRIKSMLDENHNYFEQWFKSIKKEFRLGSISVNDCYFDSNNEIIQKSFNLPDLCVICIDNGWLNDNDVSKHDQIINWLAQDTNSNERESLKRVVKSSVAIVYIVQSTFYHYILIFGHQTPSISITYAQIRTDINSIKSVIPNKINNSECILLQQLQNKSKNFIRLGDSARFLLISNLECFKKGGRDYYHENIIIHHTECIKRGLKPILKNGIDETESGYFKSYTKERRYPVSCKNYCPYYNSCNFKKEEKNLVNKIVTTKSSKITLKDVDEKYINISESRELFRKYINEAIQSEDNGVWFIRADVGMGKTYILEELDFEKDNITIAFPTHQLKDEFVQRRRNRGFGDIFTTIKPPELKFNNPYIFELEECYSQHKSDRKIYEKSYYWHLQRGEYTYSNEILDYLKNTDKYKKVESMFTTHSKALNGIKSLKTVIFDESISNKIIESEIISINILKDIEQYYKITVRTKKYEKVHDVLLLKNILEKSEKSKLKKTDSTLRHHQVIDDYMEYRKKNGCTDRFDIKILQRFTHYRQIDNNIEFISFKQIPMDKKVIIISGTGSKEEYKSLLNQNIKYRDCGKVKLVGRIHQDYSKSYSKSSIDNNYDEYVEFVKKDIAKNNIDGIITHKKFVEFKDDDMFLRSTNIPVFAYFFNSSGIDKFNGKTIGIYGTPFLSPDEMEKQKVIHEINTNIEYKSRKLDTSKFSTNSFYLPSDNDKLNHIYVGLAQEELQQCIGRARLITNDCDIYLYSNIPV